MLQRCEYQFFTARDTKLYSSFVFLTRLQWLQDIQGTGSTALAGILSALRAKGEDVTSLGDQRILIAGAGSAGIGIADVLRQAMVEQGHTEDEAKNAFYVVDQHG